MKPKISGGFKINSSAVGTEICQHLVRLENEKKRKSLSSIHEYRPHSMTRMPYRFTLNSVRHFPTYFLPYSFLENKLTIASDHNIRALYPEACDHNSTFVEIVFQELRRLLLYEHAALAYR